MKNVLFTLSSGDGDLCHYLGGCSDAFCRSSSYLVYPVSREYWPSLRDIVLHLLAGHLTLVRWHFDEDHLGYRKPLVAYAAVLCGHQALNAQGMLI